MMNQETYLKKQVKKAKAQLIKLAKGLSFSNKLFLLLQMPFLIHIFLFLLKALMAESAMVEIEALSLGPFYGTNVSSI
ncbi:hypothetical protein SCA6_007278 [Theobroma cacao]